MPLLAPLAACQASLGLLFVRDGDVVADVTEQTRVDCARRETPCAVVKLERVNIPASHDRLQRKAGKFLMNGEIADRAGAGGALDIDKNVRDGVPGPRGFVHMILEVRAEKIRDVVTTGDIGVDDLELGMGEFREWA